VKVHALIRGDLFYKRYSDVSSEITGWGYRFTNVLAQMIGSSAPSVRYEIKTSRQEIFYTAPYEETRLVRRQESAEAILAKCQG
jgi:hypothetical protein